MYIATIYYFNLNSTTFNFIESFFSVLTWTRKWLDALSWCEAPSLLSSHVGFFRWVYESFRLPIAPIYGGFPVKFRTFLGDPIPYDPNVNAAELAEKVSELKLLYR